LHWSYVHQKGFQEMKTAFVTGFLIVSALFTAWTGWISIAAPERFAKPLGFVLAGMDGRNEIRAQYGGFFLAVTVVSVLALVGKVPRPAGLLVNAVVFGGLIAGRLTSLAIEGGMNGYGLAIRTLFFIDATGFLLSIAALSIDRFSPAPH
jgi:hypothetical protein